MTPDRKDRMYMPKPNKGELLEMFALLEQDGKGPFKLMDPNYPPRTRQKMEGRNPAGSAVSTKDTVRILKMADRLGPDGVKFILALLDQGISVSDPNDVDKIVDYVDKHASEFRPKAESQKDEAEVEEKTPTLSQKLFSMFKKKK